MSKRNNDLFSELVVGGFMLVVLSLLVYFTIIISGVDVFQGRRMVKVQVEFPEVGGLKAHDNVMYRGTKVGQVESVIVSPSNLLVRIEIDRSVVIRDKYRIAVANLSMLGGNYLVLEEGEGDVLDLEHTRFVGEAPTDWMRDVSKIAANLREITGDGELKSAVSNLSATVSSARAIAERLERGEGTIGKLLSKDEAVYDDLKRTISSAADVAERVNRGEGTIGKLVSTNDTVYADLAKTLANASSISERLKSEKFMGDLEEGIAAFRKACESMDMGETVKSANELLASLNRVADKLKSGEGTIGRLVNDRAMYDEVDGLIRDVRQVIDNYRDTTPISTFGSLIMGGL